MMNDLIGVTVTVDDRQPDWWSVAWAWPGGKTGTVRAMLENHCVAVQIENRLHIVPLYSVTLA